MTDKKQFFVNGLLLTAVALSIRTVYLFFNAFVTKTVGAEGVGLFALLMTVYGFALTFATSGISLTVTRLVAGAIGEGKEEHVGGILRAAVLYAFSFGTVAAIVLFFFAPLFSFRVLSDMRTLLPLRVMSLSLIPEALSAVFVGYFVGVRRVVGNAATQVAAQTFKVVVTCLFVGRLGAVSVGDACLFLSAVSVGADLVAFLFLLVRFLCDRRRTRSMPSPVLSEMPSVAGMAVPLALSAYIRSALVTVEHTLIPICLRMRGAGVSESLASYGVLHGMTLPMILYPMATLTSFAGLLVPEFAEAKAAGNDARMCRIAGRAVHTTLVYAVGVSVLMCLFSEEVGYCLYSSYDAGYYIARIAPVIPVMYLDHITDSMLKGIGEHVYSMWVNISDACLSVLLVLLFIPRMGIGGYALVIVLMEAYNFLLSFIRLRRRIRFRVSLFRSLCLPGVAAAFAAFLSHTLFAMHGAATDGLWLFFKTAFAASVFFGLVKLSELIPNKTNIRYCKTNK